MECARECHRVVMHVMVDVRRIWQLRIIVVILYFGNVLNGGFKGNF